VARHIASHAVTVTERDTVPRASRHIRPPIRGGGNVTRDRKCGEDGIDLITRECVLIFNGSRSSIEVGSLPRLAARVIYAFERSNRTEQRPARRRTSGLPCPAVSITAGRRAQPSAFATFHASFWRSVRNWEDHGNVGEGPFARALSAIITLSERKTRARGETWVAGEIHGFDPKTDPAGGGWPRTYWNGRLIDLPSQHSAASFQIGPDFFPKILNLLHFPGGARFSKSWIRP
jgi:hypothetical protein